LFLLLDTVEHALKCPVNGELLIVRWIMLSYLYLATNEASTFVFVTKKILQRATKMFACNHAFEAMLVLACPIKISSKKDEILKIKLLISLAVHFSLEDMISKKYIYLSKLAAQVFTSTPPENLVWEP
jgi:hypothetical protein